MEAGSVRQEPEETILARCSRVMAAQSQGNGADVGVGRVVESGQISNRSLGSYIGKR